MSNSTDKMDVEVVETDWGKNWVRVTLLRSKSFFPSFEDLYRIINAICECEDKKYPNGQGRKMVANFLRDCCNVDDYQALAKQYNLPVRKGTEVVNTNGANVTVSSASQSELFTEDRSVKDHNKFFEDYS